MSRHAALIVLVGCGRVGFTSSPALDAAPGAFPEPAHHYRLDDLTDAEGGPSLNPLGGSFEADGYRFAANQGFGLATAMPVSVYTIEITIAFDALGGYRKILDFKDLTLDSGLYADDTTLDFVEDPGPPIQTPSAPVLIAAKPFQVTISRDADGVLTGYVDGVLQISTVDSLGSATFTAADTFAELAVDDNVTSQDESGSGVMRDIAIWDVVLTPEQVAAYTP